MESVFGLSYKDVFFYYLELVYVLLLRFRKKMSMNMLICMDRATNHSTNLELEMVINDRVYCFDLTEFERGFV